MNRTTRGALIFPKETGHMLEIKTYDSGGEMLSSVLNSERAIHVNIQIIKTFIKHYFAVPTTLERILWLNHWSLILVRYGRKYWSENFIDSSQKGNYNEFVIY